MLTNTYLRQFDEKTQISAIDMSYAVSGLLEHPSRLESAFTKVDSENVQPNKNAANPGDKDMIATKANPIEEVHGCLFDNFHTAYDALDLRSSKTNHIESIHRGIELTKGM